MTRARLAAGRYLLPATAALVVLGVLLPLPFLLLEATRVGWGRLWALFAVSPVLALTWNTLRLAAAVTVLCAAVGTATAWLTVRTNLPAHRLFAALLVLPLVVPDFITAWAWSSVFPAVHGYWGAVLVMTLGLYPLVHLPMAAAFRETDPGEEEVAQSLGVGRLRTFWSVTLRQARSTLLGGSLLVCLALLAEYGAFENLRYQTFTTAVFTELQIGFSTSTACALALVLVLVSLVVLFAEGLFRERGGLARMGRRAKRPPARRSLGRAGPAAAGALSLLAAAALGLPASVIAFWMAEGGSSTLPATASVAAAAGYSALYSGLGALVSTALALPVAFLATRRPARWTAALERGGFVVQAVPGVVVALALVFVSVRYAPSLYQSPGLLVVAYAMLFFPLALVAVRGSVARAPVQLEEVARSLGRGPLAARLRVTLPLVAPGLAAAACLVFLSGVTELTATLLLVPAGQQTLATQFWAYTESVSYSSAAPYAAIIIALSAVPGYLLTRWFDRSAAEGGEEPALAGRDGTARTSVAA